MSPPRICHACPDQLPEPEFLSALAFDTVMLDGYRDGAGISRDRLHLPRDCRLLLDIDMSRLRPDDPLVQDHPDCFRIQPLSAADQCVLDLPLGHRAHGFLQDSWKSRLCAMLERGIDGFRFLNPLDASGVVQAVVKELHERFPSGVFIADTPGIAWSSLEQLQGCGFSYCLSSLPWWDLHSPWLGEEYTRLRHIAPVIAMAAASGLPASQNIEDRRTHILLAAIAGSGVLMPKGFEDGTGAKLLDAVQMMNMLTTSEPILSQPGDLHVYASSARTVVLRTADSDARFAEESLIALVCRPDSPEREFDRTVAADLEDWSDLQPIVMRQTDDALRKPGATRLFRGKRARPAHAIPSAPTAVRRAVREPRIIIEKITPSVDNARYAAKRLVGDTVTVAACIFSDGHPVLAAELLYRAADETAWQRQPMRHIADDRWTADMPLRRCGRHLFMLEAWLDSYGTFVRDLKRKRDAGKDIRLDLREGCQLIADAQQRAHPGLRTVFDTLVSHIRHRNEDQQLAILSAPETIEVMRLADGRPFLSQSVCHPIDADRKAAGFSSWYELFPRSATDDPQRHGSFQGVMAQLPRIREMGFDVLYLPPIHPIGRTNRKGRNNSLVALPCDVGSAYAIGASEGGHEAIHPALGTLDDFRALLAAARDHGMELALDFAAQCSPDHPWLKQHPDWFAWRPDGTVKYAENPPKVYEDIVNVDFHAKKAVPDLWLALHDVVLFWIREGVRMFRVDNPHTKPFAFWEWLIASIRGRHPEVTFLSEAFTRPSIMYHLAKLGFTQSYTYFTWRNSKNDITAYIKELTSDPATAFFRPHFFVNTPDINPYYLQSSGRAGFLIRAALAATLSGLWGMFSGFELCESAALAGREEYLDSDKYQIRVRDWNKSGNISAEITQLNRLRRSEPALQSHLGTTFYNAFNDNIIYYGKHPLGYRHRVLVMVNLDPHNDQFAEFEAPLWEWGLPDHGVMNVEDLLSGAHFLWHGKMQRITLSPSSPYRIWRIEPSGGGHA